ncbi:hypothetical protein PGIGA_G00044050 [Pangasianodon gigas]|uniref:Uncharacterized protein n=1 Tax=Pangasianodon gigas TaxID=30993 RepID=A0ACC5X2W3_PANGG|nr:hypothetical protein [Pangasianodon gigas]
MEISPSIYPFSVLLILYRVALEPGAYPRRLGVQDTLDRMPTHRRAQSCTMDSLICNTCLWTGGGSRSTQRKPLKHRAEEGFEPPGHANF